MKLFFMDSIARSTNIILTEKIAYNNHFKAIPEINSSKVMLQRRGLLKSLVIIGRPFVIMFWSHHLKTF